MPARHSLPYRLRFDFRSRTLCTVYGIIGAFARPNWQGAIATRITKRTRPPTETAYREEK